MPDEGGHRETRRYLVLTVRSGHEVPAECPAMLLRRSRMWAPTHRKERGEWGTRHPAAARPFASLDAFWCATRRGGGVSGVYLG